MVTTITVYEITGGQNTKPYTTGGITCVYTAISNRVRLFNGDVATNQATPQVTTPVVIPTVDFNYSFWKAICLGFANASPFTINNIRHYSNGDIDWTGCTLNRGEKTGDKTAVQQGCPPANYQICAANGANSGYALDAAGGHGHAYFDGVSDVNSDTWVSVALIDSNSYSASSAASPASLANAQTYSYEVVLQVKVGTTGVQGTQTSKTLTWMYDEA